MIQKALKIGASTVGKTTILRNLREKTDLPIGEADEVLIRMNGGIYPRDSNYKMQTLAPQMVATVLAQDKIVFFTNTGYFQMSDLETARDRGFRIIQLSLSRMEMEQRNRHRVEHEGYQDLSSYFAEMLSYQDEIRERGLVDAIIETNKPLDAILREIISHLE